MSNQAESAAAAGDRHLDIAFVREQFPPLTNGWAFFENAGGSYVPRQVIDRMHTYMSETQVQPGAAYGPSALAFDRMDGARRLMADMINAQEDEIVVGPSTTLNVYVLANALRPLFREGEEIIVTNQDHEANGGAWRRLSEFGLVIREWQVDPATGELDPNDLDKLLSDKTRLVCFPHVSNIVGSLNDVELITQKVHAAGAWVCVDGVAYAPHRRMDVKKWDVDFYLFSFYKIYGPHIACLYGKRGSMMAARNQNHYFFGEESVPQKLNPGGMMHEAVASLQGVADYLDGVYRHHADSNAEPDFQGRLDHVSDLFADHEEQISQPVVDFLTRRNDVRLLGRQTADQAARVPTFAFTVNGKSSAEIVTALHSRNIAVNNHHFYAKRLLEAVGVDPDDGVVRASMVHYTSSDDVARLLDALDAVLD
jgi:cysteine desulfurase family protein (TIGR01976 family)